MNVPALAATLSVHAALFGFLDLLPRNQAKVPKVLQPVSVVYRKPVVVPPPPPVIVAPVAPVHRARKRRHRVAPAAPPPPILTAPAAAVPAAAAVVIPAQPPAPPAPPADPGLPVISEAALPEGYVAEAGFTFAPLYRVSTPPRLTEPLKPEYPARAREFQKEGIVILEVDIDAQGRVVAARIVEESGWGFGEAALKAILKSTFTPAKIDAIAVPVRYRIPIRFQMDFS